MNELIKKLAEQAGFHVAPYEGINDNDMIKKFAELLIRECIQIKDELSQFDGTTPFGDGYEEGLKDMAESIKEHFGI